MLDNLKLNKLVFLDIETVSAKESFTELSENWQALWEKKAQFISKENETLEDSYDRAAIYAEFGKIVCISVGIFHFDEDKVQFRLKSFYGHDEKQVLENFVELMNKHFNSLDYLLCAHNGKEFDFPFLGRRILVNGLKLPYLLDIAGRKPWEVQHLDTLQLWKFGDYKHYTSLDLLTQLFNIESPKSKMSGSEVGKTYWEQKDLEKIVDYCESDVVAVAQLLLAFKGEKGLKKSQIVSIRHDQ